MPRAGAVQQLFVFDLDHPSRWKGSDELFGGYPKYLFANATRWAGVIPGSVLHHVEKSLPASKSRLGIAMRAVSEPSHAERMRGWFAPFAVSERTDRSWR